MTAAREAAAPRHPTTGAGPAAVRPGLALPAALPAGVGIQLVLLKLGIGGLSLTGLGIDYIRTRSTARRSGDPLHLTLPETGRRLQVLVGWPARSCSSR